MLEFGPSQDREDRAIREMLLFRGYGPSGAGFEPISRLLVSTLARVTDDFQRIQTLAIASDSADDPQWRAYMYDRDGLAAHWYGAFSEPMRLRQIKTTSDRDLRRKFDNAYLDFAGMFIPEACKLLAQNLRSMPGFLKATDAETIRKAGYATYRDRVSPKAQVFAGLQVLGYEDITGAMAADIPHYLGGLNALSKALGVEVDALEDCLQHLCKADLALSLSYVLEQQRLRGKSAQGQNADPFQIEAKALLTKLLERQAHAFDAPGQPAHAYVKEFDLNGGGAKHNPSRILNSLNLYYAAIAGAPSPEPVEGAFDPAALRAVPWTKLRHLGFAQSAASLDTAVGEEQDETMLDYLDGRAREDLWGWQSDQSADRIDEIVDAKLQSAGFVPDPKQDNADARAAKRVLADLPGEETLGRVVLHDALPRMKDTNPGARNAFIVNWKDMLKSLVLRLQALRVHDPSIPETTNPYQKDEPSWQSPQDKGFGPYLSAAHAYIGERLKRLTDPAQGDAK